MSQINYLKVQITSGETKLAEESAQAREFKTGKTGFGFYGKIKIAGKPDSIALKLVDPDGKALTEGSCARREFSSGKKGYGFYEKATIDGNHYQCTVNFVQINSDQNEDDERYQTGLNIVKIEK